MFFKITIYKDRLSHLSHQNYEIKVLHTPIYVFKYLLQIIIIIIYLFISKFLRFGPVYYS
jgi:hypothetical protein